MGQKYMLEHLKKNPNVLHIYNSIMIECICEKIIALCREFEKQT